MEPRGERHDLPERPTRGRRREQAVVALLQHPTIEKAAAAVGVSHVTLWRWMQTEEFQQAYRKARRGSYFLNIKEHAEEGQRHLYVKDLTIAHVRQWGWRFVDELCWRKTDNGVPGGWQNRFKNAWEPIFHFSRQPQIKFRPEAVSHASEDVFGYSPENPKSRSGSGLLGCGPRAEGEGLARPSNVIEAKAEGGQGTHSAPFPRAIPEFFIRAFSDPGDVVGDVFLGSGTVLVGAALLDRIGYGTELSPAYCDVVVRRVTAALDSTAVLAGTDQTFADVAAERGVPVDPPASRHGTDARSIRHKNGMPYYGPRKRKGEPQPCPR